MRDHHYMHWKQSNQDSLILFNKYNFIGIKKFSVANIFDWNQNVITLKGQYCSDPNIKKWKQLI